MLFLNRNIFTLIFISLVSFSLSAKQEVTQIKVTEVVQDVSQTNVIEIKPRSTSSGQSGEVKKTPFELYWEKYYPNAQVLCRKFEQMTPEAIDASVKEIAKTTGYNVTLDFDKILWN